MAGLFHLFASLHIVSPFTHGMKWFFSSLFCFFVGVPFCGWTFFLWSVAVDFDYIPLMLDSGAQTLSQFCYFLDSRCTTFQPRPACVLLTSRWPKPLHNLKHLSDYSHLSRAGLMIASLSGVTTWSPAARHNFTPGSLNFNSCGKLNKADLVIRKEILALQHPLETKYSWKLYNNLSNLFWYQLCLIG